MNSNLKDHHHAYIIKSGAIISTIGVIMLILFGAILLVFPVIKKCERNCIFVSTAPQLLKQLINPLFLFISLILISLGVFLIRVVKWRI
ncbi:MAG TPA: hypothetical protein VN703_10000 [Candidatus Sulfopaludibacter sp.]|jgi:hypothetical protein|nr:hypothetical protein [Candidatus Sulfopaludibacter sp.]